MGYKCCVPGCRSRYSLVLPKDVSLHVFPTDKDFRQKWVDRIPPIGHFSPTTSSRICSLHFTESSFVKENYEPTENPAVQFFHRRRLKHNAMPSIFPDLSSHSSDTRCPRAETIHITVTDDGISDQTTLVVNTDKRILVKKEAVPTDVVSFHQKKHGISTDTVQPNCQGNLHKATSHIRDRPDPRNNWQVIFEEVPFNIYVPCMMNCTDKKSLISVRLANAKICSVFPNIDQASKEFEMLRKPLTTRLILLQSVIEQYNQVIQHDCAHEYGADFELTVSDKFVLFKDFISYYENVRKAFPSIWTKTETSVPDAEISIVQGGILELGHIPCPYISRGNVMFVPSKIVRIAAKGLDPSNDSLMLESVPFLNGWPVSPREIAFLTHLCCCNDIPLMFGRDTRLLPVSQISCLFNDKMVIGNSIQDGQTFNRPPKTDISTVTDAATSKSDNNDIVSTSTATGISPQVINFTTAIPSTIHLNPDQVATGNQSILLQNITGLRFIPTGPIELVNFQQPDLVTHVPVASTGDKSSLVGETVVNALNSQIVGCC